MTYEEAKAIKAQLTQDTIDTSKALNSIDGIGSGVMGLTPDSIKQSPEYKKARQGYQLAHEKLRKFNRLFMKNFKKEYKAERVK